MCEQNLSELGSQVANTKKTLRHSWVYWMRTKKEFLFFNCFFDCDSINNVLLWSVFNTNETKTKSNIFTFYHSFGTCTFVHNINFCNDTNSSYTFRIHLSCHLQTIRGSHISICWQNTQNNCSWIRHVSCRHCSCNLLNIFWLIRPLHWNSCYTRQINKC